MVGGVVITQNFLDKEACVPATLGAHYHSIAALPAGQNYGGEK